MNGADALMITFQDLGVRACFANPGTTELELVAALDRADRIRPVLCAQENVATGAADGYYRVTGVPALTVLHLGPGLANGWANLHNAHRGRSGVINLVGDQATWHLASDPPLATDLDALAGSFPGWVGRPTTAAELPAMAVEAFELASHGRIATLLIPQDLAWAEADPPPRPAADVPFRPAPPPVDLAADALRGAGRRALIVLGGAAAGPSGLAAAASIRSATGATVVADYTTARLELGIGSPGIEMHPYFPEPAREALAADVVVLAGTSTPVAYFGYRDQPSSLLMPTARVLDLGADGGDPVAALEALATTLGAVPPVLVSGPPPVVPPSGPLTPTSATEVFAAHQPAHAIVVEEACTAAGQWADAARFAPGFTALFGGNGGSIGGGLPLAVGAAVAAPDRRIMAIQADGSGAYTVQALWTMARERLDVTIVVLANRRYRILELELDRSGLRPEGGAARLTKLDGPSIDWVALASGFGVASATASTVGQLDAALTDALHRRGPSLIEAVIA